MVADIDFGLYCENCGAAIDEESEHFHEPSGWYTCPECGHSNDGD